jgi:hypothetical protein
MTNEPMDKREREKKRKEARKALVAFLGRLRVACKSLESIDEWLEHMSRLEKLLVEYQQVLPPDARARVRSAMKAVDTTRSGLRKTCKVLQMELERVIELLPAAGLTATGAILATLFVAALMVAAAILAVEIIGNCYQAEVTIENQGCETLWLQEVGELPVPGLDLPASIPPGGRATAQVPTLLLGLFEIDATQAGRVVLRLPLGIQVPAGLPGRLGSVRLDQQELLGRSTRLHIAARSRHTLVLSCR